MNLQIEKAMHELQEADRRLNTAVFNGKESQARYEACMLEESEARTALRIAEQALVDAVRGKTV